MHDLITRHLMAETTRAEERALQEWRDSSPRNDALYRRRVQLWALLDRGQAPAPRTAPTAAELIARAGVRQFPLPAPHPIPVRHASPEPRAILARPRRGLRVAIAGTVLAAAAAGAAVMVGAPDAYVGFGAEEFSAGPQETRTIRLDDGSVVRLAPRSRMRFDNRSPGERRVEFEGVGYFAIARDEARPFSIRTAGGDARVLGTRFELRATDEAMRVVVVEGRVALEALGERREVAANQMGQSGKHQRPTVVDVANVHDYLGWVDGLLVFEATPLSRVARALAEHYRVPIRILDAELARREVTAWLPEQSFSAALTAVCTAVDAVCTIQQDQVTMGIPPPRGGGQSRGRDGVAPRIPESRRSDVH